MIPHFFRQMQPGDLQNSLDLLARHTGKIIQESSNESPAIKWSTRLLTGTRVPRKQAHHPAGLGPSLHIERGCVLPGWHRFPISAP